MYKLTKKEEEIMTLFWERGALFVREIVENCPEPRPHFNTISTMVRTLEERGFLSHKKFGGTFQYYPVVSAVEFRDGKLSSVVAKYFDNSYLGVVSSLVNEHKIPLEELKRLIEEIERP
jgi:predicted transcriptional regulator